MDSENVSIKTPSESGKKVTFVRPKLNIPIANSSHNGFGDNLSYAQPISPKYKRKASVFILEHLNDIKQSGLGIGDRCSYWLYKKVRFLSKRWFTHCFLIIVVSIYTVCGALVFLTVEGK